MSDRHFLDTNILVYMFTDESGPKRGKAVSLVENALAEGLGVISYQVVQEFLNVATRRFATPLSRDECADLLSRLLMPLCEVFPSEELYLRALDVRAITGYTFYDSLIVAGALSASCHELLTEDMQHGREILGLTIRNPFL